MLDIDAKQCDDIDSTRINKGNMMSNGMTIYIKGLRSKDDELAQLGRMIDDLWAWLDCDGVIVVKW